MPKRRIGRRIEKHKLGKFSLRLDIEEKPKMKFDVEYSLFDAQKKIAHLYLKREGEVVFIFDLMVRPEYRRKGIGKMMIQHVIERCKKKKIPYIVGVAKEREAQNLLERMGFKRILKGSDMFLLEVLKLGL